MKNTNRDINARHLKTILSKSLIKRTFMGKDTIKAFYSLIRNAVKQKKPGLNEREGIADHFLKHHGKDLSDADKEKISARVKSH